jgi:hypothetical protein
MPAIHPDGQEPGNGLRHACLQIEPGLEPYFTSGHHDDAPASRPAFRSLKGPAV